MNVGDVSYREYIITTKQVGKKFVAIGTCDGAARSPITTQEYPTPEAAIVELTGNIDYWLAPLWTRQMAAAQGRIQELMDGNRQLEAERDRLKTAVKWAIAYLRHQPAVDPHRGGWQRMIEELEAALTPTPTAGA
jgi:hypothetical protein